MTADVFLLDDGFQHASLARDIDIVLIDGLDPFGQYATGPSGTFARTVVLAGPRHGVHRYPRH